MGSPKFFCSYAREDSEFVLKLAKELRKAGADLWLDRLDILGGQRWDEAVQAALESCQGILAILSPSAVTSQNFMDEVSYALEERKQIIPVLYQECTIPFRLRRVQYIDFLTSYDSGFDGLRALLIEHPAGRPAILAIEARVTEGLINEEELREGAIVVEEGTSTERGTQKRQGRQKKTEMKSEGEEPRGLGISIPSANASTSAMPPTKSSIKPVPGKPFSMTARGALGAAVVGSIIGAISFLLLGGSEFRADWWRGALLMGVPGAIAGAVAGTRRRVILVVLITALAGTVIAYTILEESQNRLLMAILFGPWSAIVGAVAWVILAPIKIRA